MTRQLQRKCACGSQSSSSAAPCPDCERKRRVQRSATASASHAGQAPPIVNRVLGTPGSPLPRVVRGDMERRFGHDFSHVRVHTDTGAAASARSVDAHAYTVGHHIIFGAGKYAPGHDSGRRLLAHELAHVIQQRDVVQRMSISPSMHVAVAPAEDREEREADEAARTAMERDDDEAHGGMAVAGGATHRLVLRRQLADESMQGPWPEKDEADCIRHAPPEPAECDPTQSLTWADFTARPPRGSRFSAATWSNLRERDMNVAALMCTPGAAGMPGVHARGLQAWFDPSRSWVKPAAAGSSNPAVNGCATHIADCQRAMDQAAASGGSATSHMSTAADRTCPAAARPSGATATTRAECTTVLGADCTATAAAESARLLQHEQGHFNLTCAMARKGNALLGTTDLVTLLPAARRALNSAQRSYDGETRHGCNAGAQSRWETAIADGLPAVTIDLTPPRRRRGRRR